MAEKVEMKMKMKMKPVMIPDVDTPPGFEVVEGGVAVAYMEPKEFLDQVLPNEGDIMFVIKKDGQYRWMNGNKHLVKESWKNLFDPLDSPVSSGKSGLSKKVTGPSHRGVDLGIGIEEKSAEVSVSEEQTYKPGWYQDDKGSLYEFDGMTWHGLTIKSLIPTLEYLGGRDE